MKLNTRQQEAILHAEGPAIVVAGPGSGKTAVLTHRIHHLIQKLNIPPEKIMVITFTRAAAEEMKSRFHAFPGEADAPVFFATFHAAFYRILRREEGLSVHSVLSREERFRWLREMMQAELKGDKMNDDILTEISAELSKAKAGEADMAVYQAKSCAPELFRRMAQGYEERLRISGQVDFEDMLIRTHRLLKAKPMVLRLWTERYSYILVDEFQDINAKQYEILKLLAGAGRNIFAVGDDDQSIYRFRGADPTVMARFLCDFPDAARYELFGCYRCSPEILGAARSLIEHNSRRFPKDLVSLTDKGPLPEINVFPDGAAEKAALAEALKRQHKKGIRYEKMGVLCRTNFEIAGIRSGLARAKIPVRTREAVPDIYARPETKDLFAYLELASGNIKRELFLRVMNRPLRYLPRTAVSSDPVDPGKLFRALKNNAHQLEAADQLLYQLAYLGRLQPYAAVIYVRRKIGYDDWIREKAGDGGEEALNLLDLLEEESASFSSLNEWKAFIEEQRRETSSARTESDGGHTAGSRSDPDAAEAVTLTTMHGAKGLEFDAVFLPDINEGTVPHKRSTKKEELEEERRLFYVALTRAKRYLWLGWIRKSRAGRREPSRFLREM